MSGPAAFIYLDHAATTPLDAEVAAAIAAAERAAFANPSSQHAAGRAARRVLEDARERILALLGGRGGGSRGDRLVFTSGASEANHLAILGMAAATAPGTLLFSRRDHASAVGAAAASRRLGWVVDEIGLDAAGRVDPAALVTRLAAAGSGPRIVSLTLVCGQSGAVQTVAGLGAASTAAAVHLDATQGAGLAPLDFAALGVATLALAPHKFGGPRGIGGLVLRGDVPIAPPVAGTQEHGLRPGTEAVALAAGFARALELAAARRAADAARIAAVRDRFERAILGAAHAAGLPAVVIAVAADRAPHISTVSFPGLDRQALVLAADLAGVGLATGTACASGSSEPAPALLAMGLAAEIIRGAVRFSFGRGTTAADVDEAVARLAPLLARGGLSSRPAGPSPR
jgi:cysteine desulfurase